MVVVNPADITTLDASELASGSGSIADFAETREILRYLADNMGGGGGQWSKAWYVDMDSGNDTNSGASPTDAFKTIQKGLDSAGPGDVVFAWGGSVTSPVAETDITFSSDGVTLYFLGAAIDVSGMSNFFMSTNGHNSITIGGMAGIFCDNVAGDVFILDGSANSLFKGDGDKGFLTIQANPGTGRGVVVQDTASLLTIGNLIRNMVISYLGTGIEIVSPTVKVNGTTIEMCSFENLTNGIVVNGSVTDTVWSRCSFKSISGSNYSDSGSGTKHNYNYYEDNTHPNYDGIFVSTPTYDTNQYASETFVNTGAERMNTELDSISSDLSAVHDYRTISNVAQQSYVNSSLDIYTSRQPLIPVLATTGDPDNTAGSGKLVRINQIELDISGVTNGANLTIDIYSSDRHGSSFNYIDTVYIQRHATEANQHVFLLDAPLVFKHSSPERTVKLYIKSDNASDTNVQIITEVW